MCVIKETKLRSVVLTAIFTFLQEIPSYKKSVLKKYSLGERLYENVDRGMVQTFSITTKVLLNKDFYNFYSYSLINFFAIL